MVIILARAARAKNAEKLGIVLFWKKGRRRLKLMQPFLQSKLINMIKVVLGLLRHFLVVSPGVFLLIFRKVSSFWVKPGSQNLQKTTPLIQGWAIVTQSWVEGCCEDKYFPLKPIINGKKSYPTGRKFSLDFKFRCFANSKFAKSESH